MDVQSLTLEGRFRIHLFSVLTLKMNLRRVHMRMLLRYYGPVFSLHEIYVRVFSEVGDILHPAVKLLDF